MNFKKPEASIQTGWNASVPVGRWTKRVKMPMATARPMLGKAKTLPTAEPCLKAARTPMEYQ
jgi:hypothetical protein